MNIHSRSSSTKSMTEEAKQRILSHLPADAKVFATIPAKVYHAPFGGNAESWTYSGLHGTLVFGRDRVTLHPEKKTSSGPGGIIEQRYWFRLLDLSNGKGLVWMHQVPDRFEYRVDKPFFHVFEGKTRMFGFRFEEDIDAAKFLKKVTTHLPKPAPSSPFPKLKRSDTSTSSLKKRILPSMISSPNPETFVHLAHVGFDRNGRIEVSDDIEPGWTMMLEELKGYGVNEATVPSDRDFSNSFLAGFKRRSSKSTKIKVGSPTAQTANIVELCAGSQ
ncbi:hypothetical protein C8Q75DRAFT_454004 [Abortiporus biennis]|nr:hypothetical protein C8Q75DRAFT_454004 [Abortiporus biennis]